MSRHPTPLVSAENHALWKQVHDLCYLALRKDPTPPERRVRLQEIFERPTLYTYVEGLTMADAVTQLQADRAFIMQDRRVDRSVMYGAGDRDFTRPYQCFADLRAIPPQKDPDHHA
ncbi:hypothetical protein SAMN05192565_112117 [Methylobacterium gossipiicola]|jgi:hypothetical protein|uniref:Uncharacterized protein n=2 Tax=Methylobacteriaceae TaxID=119045 RepID=A0A1I2UZC5_9HYPH|nr:hypothetical protein SAMN05192565_112117 [Methylobacterium gossipiicola]